MGRTVFVVSNGAIRDTGFLADQIIRADDPVIICTDGAAERMREIGRVPHMIVGDMDSKGRKGVDGRDKLSQKWSSGSEPLQR